MKHIFMLWLIFVPVFGFGQVVDTVAVEREVDSLIQISRALAGKKDFEKALEMVDAAKKRIEQVWGRESVNYSICLHIKGLVFFSQGKYIETEPLWLEVKTIREKVLGKEHPEYATSINNLAVLYYELSKYDKAESLYLEAQYIREKVLGKEHPDYATTLNNLANLYSDLGNYEEAEPLYLKARDIRERGRGKEHPEYAMSLNNLAIFYKDMGNYEKSERFYLEAKIIIEKVLGKEHPYYSSVLNNLASLYLIMGNYNTSESLFLEVKSIREEILGNEHPDYAMTLNNLANLYYDLGNFEKAEPLYLRSKSIWEKVFGKEHPRFAMSLNNLANLYRDMGNYAKAESLYLETKDIREKILGKKHLHYAQSLNNLAIFYKVMGNFSKAESLYLEAKDIREKILGKEHQIYAMTLINLANLYSDLGDYEKSQSFYLDAKDIIEKVLGKEHLAYFQIIDSLARLYVKTGNCEKAIKFYEELVRLNQNHLLKSVTYLSEHELNKYTGTFSETQNQFLSFTQIDIGQVTRLAPLAYSNALLQKGFLLQAANQTSRLALTDSLSTEKYYSLKGYRRRLAAQYALPIAERDSALIADLEEKANTLEKDLVRTVAGYGEALRQVKWEEVRDQLKKDQAAIEFVHYRYYDKKAKATDSTMYSALVLLPGDTAPHFISLCEARQLEAIFNQKTPPNLYYQNIYNSDGSGASPLYHLLWAPLESYLQGVKTVYFSPSGLLHRLNLGAIQPARRETLGDRYHLVAMGSTRNLVVPPTASVAGNTAALFGGIQYEMDSTKIAVTSSDTSSTSLVSRGSGGFIYTDSTLRGGAWNYLPATEKEITVTDNILKNNGFQTSVYRDYAATEEVLQQTGNNKSPSPRVLHIATHGFFFPDPKDTLNERRLMSGEEPVFKISDNPMIRSGLLLAGSNYAWKTGRPLRPGMEDGILTAYEISQMNLRNTELVVLSACETGLGQIEGNEGVYGLQRAFKIAGAKYLLMSLWKVPDGPTQELMEVFYKNWLDGRKSIPEAFRLAQAEMRKKYPNPFYWAGFVLVE